MKQYLEPTPISVPPKKEGRYVVTNGLGFFEVNYDNQYGFHEEFTDCSGITHYLAPVEGVLFTKDQVESALAIKSQFPKATPREIINSLNKAK